LRPRLFLQLARATGWSLWDGTYTGDTIDVWIVDVDGKRLFIAGEIHRDTFQAALDKNVWTEADRTRLRQEMQQIVDSIEFE
jgi:hypothetical protein